MATDQINCKVITGPNQIDVELLPPSTIDIAFQGGATGPPGPPGPTAVSGAPNNKAIINTLVPPIDNLILVQGAAPNTAATATQVVSGDDPRLTNARPATTPLPFHAATHDLGGTDVVQPDWISVQNKPLAFAPSVHGAAHLTGAADPIPVAGPTTSGIVPGKPNAGVDSNGATQVVMGDDTRLINPRTPMPHGPTHVTSADLIPLPTTTARGLVPPIPANATEYLDGTGNWSTPPGAGGPPQAHEQTHTPQGTNTDPLPVASTTLAGLCPPVPVAGSNAQPGPTPVRQVVMGDDTRLTNARTPMPHESTHTTGAVVGSDIISVASPVQTGLMPARSGVAGTYLDVSGSWSTPPGPGSGPPQAHQTSHVTGGDQILSADPTRRGLMPQGNGLANDFYASDGTQKQVTYGMLGGTQPAPLPHAATHRSNGVTDVIALADATASGLLTPLRAAASQPTDYIRGDNTAQDLGGAVQPIIWSARLRSFNAIGNPTFEVDQRNVGNALTNPVGGTFIQDRYAISKNLSAGAVNTALQTGLVLLPGTNFAISNNFQRFTVGAALPTPAAGDYFGFVQYVEGPRWRELSSDVHSISLLVRSVDVAGLQFSIALANPGRTSSLVRLSPALALNTWTLITLPNLPLWSGSGFVATPGLQAYFLEIYLACGSTYYRPATPGWQAADVRGVDTMSNFLATLGARFDIVFIQHEPGALCTTLIDKPFTQNYDECLQYYTKSYDYATIAGSITNTGAGILTSAASFNASLGDISFPKRLAKTPSCISYNPGTGAANSARDAASTTDYSVTGIGVSQGGISQINISPNTPTNPLTYIRFHYTADTGW